jgi:NAD(P)-dependent dehydrogenase (short-subunit alcohol dehydrogenase family)
MGNLEGRVAVVTGAGRGIGRAHAELLAAEGAAVVVNDAPGDGASAAREVIAAIASAGHQAVAAIEDVATWSGAERLIAVAVDHFGRLDILVNNAGIVRFGTADESPEADWDETMRVNLKGHIGPSHFAARHWRARAAAGETVYGRIINTTSGAAYLGLPGFACYDTAKAGVIGLTVVMAQELADIGVTVNAVAPAARTGMTSHLVQMRAPARGFDAYAPENNSPLVAWLASPAAAHVSGQVLAVLGDRVELIGPMERVASVEAGGQRWTADALAVAAPSLFSGHRSGVLALGPVE